MSLDLYERYFYTPMAYVPNPDSFFRPAQVQPTAPNQPKTYAPLPSAPVGSTLGASDWRFAPSPSGTFPSTPAPTPAPTPQQQQPQGSRSITERDALRLGFDWNNLPGGYSRNVPQQQGPSQAELAAQQAAQQTRNDINSGFDSYTSQLDQMLGTLPGQEQGQKQIAQNSYNQGISDIGAQKASSTADLATSSRKNSEQQVKSLADIADNIRNLFQTGNVMLGTRGAGDSSAADRYSYAVTKLGSKQRGDVLAQTRSIENDIADRSAKLNNIVTQETAKLKTNFDNQVLQEAQYFQDKQNELLQAKANGQLQRGQSLASLSSQLLNVAQQQLMAAEQNHRTQQNSLLQWAENNSKTIGQLKDNLAQLGQYSVPGVVPGQINGQATFDAQGNLSVPMFGGGGSSSTTKDKQLFGPTAGAYTFR